jgi:hypothetical protein
LNENKLELIGRSMRRGARRGGTLAAALVLASCFASPTAQTPYGMRGSIAREVGAVSKHPVVVVVALDGVRWQEIFEGVDPKLARQKNLKPGEIVGAEQLMPKLHEIIETRGAAVGAPGHGAPIDASGPNYVSLPGYMEMLSGKRRPPCTANDCKAPSDPTLADAFAARSEGWATEVGVIASWPDLARAAARFPERVVVSAGRHGGTTRYFLRYDAESAWLLDESRKAKAYPGYGDFRPDRYTAAIALRYLKKERPRFLFIGLGEPDAYAHRGLYRNYLAALQQADGVIGQIDASLADLRRHGWPATLFVTTDHGRGKRFAGHGAVAPESARVWLVATGTGIVGRGLVNAPVERRLADLAPTVRVVARLGPEQIEAGGSVLTELTGD